MRCSHILTRSMAAMLAALMFSFAFATLAHASAPIACQAGLAGTPGLLAAVDAGPGGVIPWSRVLRFVGKFHVLFIHFPIALLVAAAFGDVAYRLSGRDLFASSSRFCVMLGAPSAVAAAALGWSASTSVHYTATLEDVLTTHQWLGTATALWSLVTLGLMVRAQKGKGSIAGACYQIALYAGSALVGVTAHMGGTLIYGRDYLVW